MRVWIWPSAEVVALDSVGVGDVVAWSCRAERVDLVDLPPGIARDDVLIEDADHAMALGDDFVEVSGCVTSIRVAHDRSHAGSDGRRATPGTRTWSDTDRTPAVGQEPAQGMASGYLVELAPV